MQIILTLLAFLAIAAFEFPPLRKENRRGELLAAGVVWLAALVFSTLQVLDLPYPDVNYPIKLLTGFTP